MYGKLNSIKSSDCYKVTGAHPEAVLNALVCDGVDIICAEPTDEFTLMVTVLHKHGKALEALAARVCCDAELVGVSGSRAVGKKILSRLFAIIFGAAVLFAVVGSRFFVWEISVSGNEKVRTGEILAALQDCDVKIGSFWPSFTSDRIRNELVSRLPELSWATVNIYGSRAEVLVRERVAKPEMVDESVFADIVAGRDGVVSSIQTLIGTQSVKNGKAVQKGDVLISGTLLSLTAGPKYTCAFGNVKAFTWYEITATMPKVTSEKIYTGGQDNRFALKIGGWRLNFYGNSSILDTSCDKINNEWKLAIDGLFTLPVSLVREKSVYYETSDGENAQDEAERLLCEYLAKALRDEVSDGDILTENYTLNVSDDTISVCLRAACLEEIGVSVLR